MGTNLRNAVLAPVLALLLLMLPPAAGAREQQAASFDELGEQLRGWRIAAAEQTLAKLEAAGVEIEVLAPAAATLRFYQGEYQEALRLLEGRGSSELRRLIEAAAEAARPMKEVRSPDGHWRIRVLPGPDEVLLPLLLEALPRIRRTHGEAFGVFPISPVLIEIHGDPFSVARATGLSDEQMEISGTIAICKFNRIMVTSPRATLRGFPWLTTVSHEYVHFLVNRRSFDRVPIWLHEGLARYNELRWKEGRPQTLKPDTEAMLLQALADDELLSFEEMSVSMPMQPTQRHVELAFAELLSFTHMLYSRVGQEGINRILDRLGRRELSDARQAVEAELGQGFASMERSWRAQLGRRHRPRLEQIGHLRKLRFRKGEQDPFRVDLEDIHRKARDHAYLGQLLRGQSHPRAALVEYDKAARANRGSSPVIQSWIAATHLELGEPAHALEALEEVARLYPDFAATHVNQGLALVALDRGEQARPFFEAALEINPFDPRIHQELHRIYEAADHPLAVREAEAIALLSSRGGRLQQLDEEGAHER